MPFEESCQYTHLAAVDATGCLSAENIHVTDLSTLDIVRMDPPEGRASVAGQTLCTGKLILSSQGSFVVSATGSCLAAPTLSRPRSHSLDISVCTWAASRASLPDTLAPALGTRPGRPYSLSLDMLIVPGQVVALLSNGSSTSEVEAQRHEHDGNEDNQ